MANRVNKKFVFGLTAAVVLLAVGIIGLGLFATQRSGVRNISRGDAAMAAGEYQEAASRYSKAVSRDRTNNEWLLKWQDALLRTTPGTRAGYERASQQHLSILRTMAMNSKRDAGLQLAYIEELDRRTRLFGSSLSGLQNLAEEVTSAARLLDPSDEETAELLAYRGRAIVDEMGMLTVDAEREELALEDLERARSAQPDEAGHAVAVARWYLNQVAKHERTGRRELAAEARARFDEEWEAIRAEFPDAPDVMSLELRLKRADALREATTLEERARAVRGLGDEASAVLDRALALEASSIETGELLGLARAALLMTFGAEAEPLLTLVRRVSSSRAEPEPELLLAEAEVLRRLGRPDEALSVYEEVLALETPPVSLEGLALPFYQRQAAGSMVDATLAQVSSADSPERRRELLEAAEAHRDRLAELVDVSSQSELSLRDARIAMMREDFSTAVKLLNDLRVDRPEDAQILEMLGMALRAQGNLGEAKSVFEDLLAEERVTYALLVRLADTEYDLENLERARDLYRQAGELTSDRAYVDNRLEAVERALSGGEEGVTSAGSTDPVVSAALEARRLRAEGSLAGARERLLEARADRPGSVTLASELVSVELAAGDRAAAVEHVRTALEANPDDDRLRRLETLVEIEDSVEAMLTVIDESDEGEVSKEIGRYMVLTRAGRSEDAAESLGRLEELAPRDPRVVELGFNRALSSGDMDSARRWAERAAEGDADKRGGLLYQGRLELAEGDAEAAADTLRRAVDMMEFDPASWFWLGTAQRRLGRVDDAVSSFRRAHEGRPREPRFASAYAELLRELGRGEEALAVVNPETGVLRFGVGDASLNALWLALEAEHGDRERVYEARRERFGSEPGDVSNAVALVEMLTTDERYDEAEAVLDGLSEGGLAATTEAQLRSQVAGRRGDVERGREILRSAIGSSPEGERAVELHLALAQYEREYGTLESALAAYEAGRPHQDPELRQVDRAIGDLMFSRGESLSRVQGEEAERLRAEAYAAAAEAYERVLESKPDDARVAKRTAETLLRLDRPEEAERLLAGLPEEDDLESMLLRVSILAERGRVREARTLLDRAVERHANNPVVFVQRARFNASEESLLPDVLNDLDRAVKLNPRQMEAWGLLYGLLASRGRVDEALGRLSAAVEANPENEALLLTYVNRLVEAGRLAEARELVNAEAERRETDEAWLERAATLASRARLHREAARWYGRLYELNEEPRAAANLLDALLMRDRDPTTAEVNRLLRKVAELEEPVLPTVMLRCRAQAFLGNDDQADRLALEGYRAAESQLDYARWFEWVVDRYEGDQQEALAFLDSSSAALGELPAFLRLLRLRYEFIDGREPATVLDRLASLEEACAVSPFTRLEYHRMRNQVAYAAGDYEQVVAACRAGLEVSPGDLELNNNLAYTLAKHLGDAESALPHAQAAEAAAPLNAPVLDTLGWIYLELDRVREAERVLTRAESVVGSADERVPVSVHLGMAKLRRGETGEARRYLRLAEGALSEASETIRSQYASEVESLSRELAGAE